MRLKERTKAILETSIRDFIEIGIPITSERLYQKYDFGIRPAMIRRELNNLTKEGYLYQEHTSGGRIPSDKSYRFFVHTILLEEKSGCIPPHTRDLQKVSQWLRTGERRRAVRWIAEWLGALSVAYEPETTSLYESGIDELFSELDIEKEEIVSIAQDFEMIAERLFSNTWWQEEKRWPRVFIGKSPVTTNKHLSVVMTKIGGPKKQTNLLLTIGPKRMDYEKSLEMCRYLMYQ